MDVAIITGAAKGIGLAVAERLARDASCLLLVDVDETGLNEVAHRIGGACRILTLSGSVADEAVAARAVELARAEGRLGLLSHNAGIQRYGTVETTSTASWDEVIGTNLSGAFFMSRAAMPALREARGSVVHMASTQGFVAQHGVVAYATAKHGLIGLIRAMAVDAAQYGVRVNGVAPGAVDTPMLRDALALADDPARVRQELERAHPLGRIATPAEVAEVVAFLASPGASFVTGEIVRVDGGQLAQLGGSPRAE
jgi:NAD(P)-dependent dehydrogenase (short-subunit alcohol dehydrogenase family)